MPALSHAFTAELSDEVAPAALEAEWDRLFAGGTAEPSTSFEWTRALSHSHLRTSDQQLLLKLVKDRTLSGVVPLVMRRSRRMGWAVSALTPISEYYNTHSDVLTNGPSPAAIDALVAGVLGMGGPWDVFRMNRLIDGSPLQTALEDRLRACGARF